MTAARGARVVHGGRVMAEGTVLGIGAEAYWHMFFLRGQSSLKV